MFVAERIKYLVAVSTPNWLQLLTVRSLMARFAAANAEEIPIRVHSWDRTQMRS